MTTIDPQNGLPKLVPINAGRSSASTIDIFLTTSSVSNGLGVGSLTPTVVSGGTAYVLESFTGTELNSAYATSAPTTAFQFVSPSRLFTYSAPSTEIAWSLTGKGGTEGGWSIYTTTLPTGMAQGPLTTQKPGVTQSLLEFFSVDWGSRIPSVVSAPSTTVEASSSETANTSSETTEQTASSSVRSTQVRHTKGATVTMGSLTGSSTPSTSQPSSTCHSSSNSSEEGETGSSTSSDSGGEVSSATGSGTSSETSNVTGSASSTSSQATRAPISSTKTTSAKTSTTSERESSNLPANFIAKTTDGSDVPKSAASRSWVRISASSTALAAVLICLTLVLNPL